MKHISNLLLITVSIIAAVSCSSAKKMATSASGIQISCEPAVLTVVAGQVSGTVTVTFPEDYFHPKAIVEVTPVIVYEGGESEMSPYMYQGENVKDNYKVVSSAGATITEKFSFPFVSGMEKSYLELRGVVTYKSKKVQTPAIKVADGVITTSTLVCAKGSVTPKPDGYQAIIKQTAEGQILYSINSSDIRSSELNSQSVKDFRAALSEIQKDERKTVTGTEIVAYASPDGGEKLNDRLSDRRSSSAGKVWKKVSGGNAEAPELKSIGQDWEGFRDLVSRSDIEDKDLILRVLSMYSDPVMRENEIKNMAEIYKSLKGDVLPELRRARFIANVEYRNYSSEELLEMLKTDIDVLDESALLHAATLVKDNGLKRDLYYKASARFDSDKARFNIVDTYLEEDDLNMAKATLPQIQTKDADYYNLCGVIALREGDLELAEKSFKAAGTPDAMANLGVVDILKGNYDKAAQEFASLEGNTYNKVLSLILAGRLDEASKAAAECSCPRVAYLKAVIAARQGDANAMKLAIEEASKDPELSERAAKDIEFAAFK